LTAEDLADINDGAGNLVDVDPTTILGPLDHNGGLTQTHALLVGSPAIDAGNPMILMPPASDQRGIPYERCYVRH